MPLHLIRRRAEVRQQRVACRPVPARGRRTPRTRGSPPLVAPSRRDLDVELHAVGRAADAEGLVAGRPARWRAAPRPRAARTCRRATAAWAASRAGRRRRDRRRPRRSGARAARRPRAPARRRRARRAPRPSSCTPRHEPQNGTPRSTASRISAFSSDQPGVLGLVVDAHRAAHGDDRVEAVERRAAARPRRARRGAGRRPVPPGRPRRRRAARRRCAGGRGCACRAG